MVLHNLLQSHSPLCSVMLCACWFSCNCLSVYIELFVQDIKTQFELNFVSTILTRVADIWSVNIYQLWGNQWEKHFSSCFICLRDYYWHWNCSFSNQPIAGSIIIKHIILRLLLSLHSIVWRPSTCSSPKNNYCHCRRTFVLLYGGIHTLLTHCSPCGFLFESSITSML